MPPLTFRDRDHASNPGGKAISQFCAASSLVEPHHAVAGEPVDLGWAEAQFGEDLPGLRAKRLRRQADLGRFAVVTHRMIDQRDRRAGLASAGKRDQRLHVLDLRILDDLGIALHRRVPDFGTLEQRDVAAAVQFLVGRGFGPIALMGISMGGSVAIMAAPDLPVAAVVADAAYADLRNPISNRMREAGYPLVRLGARLVVGAASLRAGVRLRSPIRRVASIAPRGLLLIAPAEPEVDAFASPRLPAALALLAEALRRLQAVEGPVPLNAWLHDTAHWHIEVLPRLAVLAGIELGAGIFVNALPPAEAAARLQG